MERFTGRQRSLVIATFLFMLLFMGFGNCSRIMVLFVLWKPRCKFVFDHEPSSLSPFSSVLKDEVHYQWLAKELF